MIRCLFLFLFLVIGFSSSSMEKLRQIDVDSASNYKIKWSSVGLEEKGFDFHKVCAKKLATNKVNLGLKDPSNLAVVGLSIHNKDKSKYVVFPNIIYSTYNTLEDTPSTDDSGASFMSIADMMRSDMIEGKTRVHRISDFLFYLFSFSYTRKWGLYDGIKACSKVIEKAVPSEMSRIPQDKNISEVLHCEQVFLYRTLITNGVLEFLVKNLLEQSGVMELLKLPDSYMTFDILTYNDMCPKCFSTCYHMSETLFSRVNEAIVHRTKVNGTFCSIFDSRGGELFDVKIQVSSFRPYPAVRKTKKGGYPLYDRAAYVNKMISPVGVKKIDQFFNPWVAQYIFEREVEKYLDSIKKLSKDEEFKDNWNLLNKLHQLEGSITQEVKERIAKRILVDRGIFVRSDVCKSALNFLREFAKSLQGCKDFDSFLDDISVCAQRQEVKESVVSV